MNYQRPALPVETYQVTPLMRDTMDYWPDWLKEAWEHELVMPSVNGPGILYVKDLWGKVHTAKELDWIVYDYDGFHVVPDIEFSLLYEPVPEVTTQGLPEALEATQWAVDVMNKEYIKDGKFVMKDTIGAKLKAAGHWFTLGTKLSKI